MQSTQAKLESAASGLLMMSESDYPFTYFSSSADTINDDLALQLAGKPAGTTIEVITLDYLFRNMANAESGSVSPEEAARFQNLAGTLQQELTDLTVYRVGDVQVDVFITGKTPQGDIAGMHTKLIET